MKRTIVYSGERMIWLAPIPLLFIRMTDDVPTLASTDRPFLNRLVKKARYDADITNGQLYYYVFEERYSAIIDQCGKYLLWNDYSVMTVRRRLRWMDRTRDDVIIIGR